jgi:uncharacterized glyoxalase superfamily protein PhnB
MAGAPARAAYTRGMDHQLHGIQPVMQVADLPAAIAFYRDVLGFTVDFVAGDPPVHARLASGTLMIRLVPFEGGGARRDRSYSWIYVGRDLDGLFERYRAAGVEIVGAPTDQPWGLRDFRIRDRDGHLYCFAAELA